MKTILSSTLLVLCLNYSLAQDFDGIWQSQGYGIILDIQAPYADLYDFTSVSCIFEDEYTVIDDVFGYGPSYDLGYLEITGDQLLMTSTGGTKILFDPISALPSLTPNSAEPQLNFDVFWHTLNEWCALFEILPNVDWQAEYDYYDALIDNSTSNPELFGYLSELLAVLNDGHSYIDANSAYFEGGPMIGALWYDYEYEMMDLIEDEYIDGGNYIFSNSDYLSYGTINDSIGYLAVNSFDGFANDYEPQENLAFEAEIDEALNYLQPTTALILDVRFNYGGYDSNARILAERLVAQSQEVYSKQARIGAIDEFGITTSFSISPNGTQYINRPVVVLTSSGTISAADVFAMMAKQIECVTLIGEPSYGIFSDGFAKYLPNGWEFGFSPERYQDLGGQNYEQVGIPPDLEVIGDLGAFMNGTDNILEAAIAEIHETCEVTSVSDLVKLRVKISPNPVVDHLEIRGTGIKSVEIYSVDGKLIQSFEQQLSKLNLSALNPGLYLLKIKGQSGESVFKIVKS